MGVVEDREDETKELEEREKQNWDKLLAENAALKQANVNIIQFTFSIANSLDDTGRALVKAGNALFIISEQLKGVIRQNQSTNAQT